MDEPQPSGDAGTRREAKVWKLRGWKAYAVVVPLAVLMTPVVVLLAVVRVVAGSRVADRLISAVDRRVGGPAPSLDDSQISAAATAASDRPPATSDAAEAAPNLRNRRSGYERLYEGARIMVLVAAGAALLQMWQGWPVFDYVAFAFVPVAVVGGAVLLGDWFFQRRQTNSSAVS